MPSHLARAALVVFWVTSMAGQGFAQQPQPTVTWLSPTKGDDFVAGDTVTIKWENDQTLNGPNILLCYSSQGELSRNKQDCAPERYPPDGTGAGVHTLDVTIPAVLGQDTFLFLIGDASGNRFLSPPFSIRPPGIPLIKASDVLPKTPAPTRAAGLPAITDGPVTAAVDKPSNNKNSVAIGLGTSLSIAGFAILLFCLFLWRRRSRKRQTKAAKADLEAGSGASVSRSSSFASSLHKPSVTGTRRDGAPQGSPSGSTGIEKEETSHKEPHGALPFFNIMSRESSAASKMSNFDFVRSWLPPIPRVWRFFGEEREKSQSSRNSPPGMTPVGSQTSQVSQTTSDRISHPPSLRPGKRDRAIRHSTSSSSTSSSTTSAGSSIISRAESPITREEEEAKDGEEGVEQEESEEPTQSPPMEDSELLQPIPKVYHPESIGAAMDGLRQRERDTVASLDSFERA